jgi:ribosomal protein L22
MARDAGTKIDQPSDGEGQGPDPKVEQEAAEAKAAQATEQAEVAAAATEEKPPKKAAAKRKPAAKKAEGTAAAKTDVDKDAAEAGATGAEAPAKPKRTRKPKTDAPATSRQAETPVTRRRRQGASDPTGRVIVRAHAKYVRSSARKARLVADHVRGKDVDQARALLAFSPRSVADDWRKLLESAIANAEHNHDLVGDDLRVLNATADEGPTLKRFRPRAMGRATRIRKRTAHLTITLTPKD